MKSESSKRQEIFHRLHDGGCIRTLPRSYTGFQTCRIADFQIGNATKLQRHLNYSRFADLEIRDTADFGSRRYGGAVRGCARHDGSWRNSFGNPIPSSYQSRMNSPASPACRRCWP